MLFHSIRKLFLNQLSINYSISAKHATFLEQRGQIKISNCDELGNNLLLSRLNSAQETDSEMETDLESAIEESPDMEIEYPY